MEKKEKIESVPVAEVITEKVVEQKIQQKPVRRKRIGLKLFFWLLVLGTFGGVFTVLGVYVSRSVIPEAEQWLADHNFRGYSSTNGQENSPFLPQPSGSVINGQALTIPQVVKKSSPSVVSITVVSKDGISDSIASDSSTIGTGFIVDSSGIIVTNQHVVRDLKAEYEVVTQDNKRFKTKNIVRDEVNDIALIVLDTSEKLPALPIGSSSQIEVGETVIAIGTPLGEYPGSVTVGVISGLGRSVTTGDGFWELKKEYGDVIQTDAAINPGNSGGPLLNLFGEVVGVNFATTGGASNISFALPIDVVKTKLAEYKQYGKFRSPYLGVNYRMVLAQEAEFYNVQPGALVRTVVAESPAAKGGIKVSDIITKVNAKAVTSSLADSLAKFKVGDEVTLTVVRTDIQGKSETVSVKVTLIDRPNAQ